MSATSCTAREMAGNVARACVLAVSWSSSSGTQPPMSRSGRRAVAQGSASRWAPVSGSSSPLAWARASGRCAAISPGCRPRRTRCRVVQGQGQTLDPGPLGHEAEVDGQHRGFAAEEDVVIAEVAVGQLPRRGMPALIRCVPAGCQPAPGQGRYGSRTPPSGRRRRLARRRAGHGCVPGWAAPGRPLRVFIRLSWGTSRSTSASRPPASARRAPSLVTRLPPASTAPSTISKDITATQTAGIRHSRSGAVTEIFGVGLSSPPP